MQNTPTVYELTLRRIALEEGVDYRTVKKALAGDWIRGDFCRERAQRAAARIREINISSASSTTTEVPTKP